MGDGEALRQLLRGELNQIESEIGRETLEKIKQRKPGSEKKTWEIGDLAYSPTLGVEGRIETEADNKGNVVLRSGQLQIKVPLAGLVEAGNAPKKEKAKSSRQAKGDAVRTSKRLHFTSELNIIGKTTAEGEEILAKYLDDAVLAGAEAVRIVHGKGTGALRKAVQDYLARDPRVATFRQAAFGEGDAGVTIAELKS